MEKVKVDYIVCHTCGVIEYRPWSKSYERWGLEMLRKHRGHEIDFCRDEIQEGEVVPWR